MKELGPIKGITVKIQVDPQVHPRFHKPRPVPFSLRQKVEDELVRLEKEGIIQARQFADWAAPSQKRWLSENMWGLQGDSKHSHEGRHSPNPEDRGADVVPRMECSHCT